MQTSAPKVEAVCSSKMAVSTYKLPWRYNPEEHFIYHFTPEKKVTEASVTIYFTLCNRNRFQKINILTQKIVSTNMRSEVLTPVKMSSAL
jgi:hypothetical protein